MATESENAAKSAADRKNAAKEAQKASLEEMKKDREVQAKVNEEKMSREAKYRPTPTPEEIQMAMAGMNVDEKEPDGSPEQDIYSRIIPPAAQIEKNFEANNPAGRSGYATRDAKAEERKVEAPRPKPPTP